MLDVRYHKQFAGRRKYRMRAILPTVLLQGAVDNLTLALRFTIRRIRSEFECSGSARQ